MFPKKCYKVLEIIVFQQSKSLKFLIKKMVSSRLMQLILTKEYQENTMKIESALFSIYLKMELKLHILPFMMDMEEHHVVIF